MNLVRWMGWTNGLLALSALIQVVTVILLLFGLNPVIGVETIAIHKFNGLVLTLLIAVHVALNWPWFKAHYFRRRPVNRLTSKKI